MVLCVSREKVETIIETRYIFVKESLIYMFNILLI